jgi:hypothetical protein
MDTLGRKLSSHSTIFGRKLVSPDFKFGDKARPFKRETHHKPPTTDKPKGSGLER